MTNWTFTSESVTEGHPDKMADRISDSILDALLEEDPRSRVACETLVTTGMAVIEETLTGLSGAIRDSTVTIPDRAIVLGVSSSTVTAITGATSYDCGIASEASKFGGSLGIAAGSTNRGVIGPQAFYADTPIRLTARGGSFIGGAVRIAIHLLTVGLPS